MQTFVFVTSLVSAIAIITFIIVKTTLAVASIKARIERAEAVVHKVEVAMEPEPASPEAMLGVGMLGLVVGGVMGALMGAAERRREPEHTHGVPLAMVGDKERPLACHNADQILELRQELEDLRQEAAQAAADVKGGSQRAIEKMAKRVGDVEKKVG
ncbi:MAG: hypothetical protein KDB07_03205 [Planctomycetes bacterium]|nr:hypothetical protein [Planctomycetota bacterium]